MNKDNVWKVIRLIKMGELSLEGSKAILNEKEWLDLVNVMESKANIQKTSLNWTSRRIELSY
jgi:hypothetical protein